MDLFTPAERSRLMSRVRSTENRSTELRLRSLLRQNRIRGWRRHVAVSCSTKVGKSQTVRPDFVFRRRRIVIFVDGCFWHGCPRHGSQPQTRRVWWSRKLPILGCEIDGHAPPCDGAGGPFLEYGSMSFAWGSRRADGCWD